MEKVLIFQKAVIGSKGWGYEDSSSDLDIRFFYVQRPEEYISISKKSDVITFPIQNGEDIVGYDIGKVLKLVCNSNPTIYEIINSPIQLENNDIQRMLKSFSNEVLDIPKMVDIYQHLIDKRIIELEKAESSPVKLYIYVLRMIGTINYLQSNKKFPTCSIEYLFNDESNLHLRELLNRLVNSKKEGLKSIKKDMEIISILKKELEKTRNNRIEKGINENQKEIEKRANELFFRIVQDYSQVKKNNELEETIDVNELVNKPKL